MGEIVLSELLVPVQSSSTLFSNNCDATYLEQVVKHLAIDYHFVRDLVQSFKLRVVPVSAGNQLADALTKSLSLPRLFSLYNKIDVIYKGAY